MKTHLIQGNLPSRIILPNGVDNAPSPRASISAPDEVEARKLDVVLVLAARDRRRDERAGIGDAIVVGGGRESRCDRLLDGVDEEDED